MQSKYEILLLLLLLGIKTEHLSEFFDKKQKVESFY